MVSEGHIFAVIWVEFLRPVVNWEALMIALTNSFQAVLASRKFQVHHECEIILFVLTPVCTARKHLHYT